MRAWLQRNILIVCAGAAFLGGLGYIWLARNHGVPTAWVICISALITLYGFFTDDSDWPRVPSILVYAAAFVWISFATGSLLIAFTH